MSKVRILLVEDDPRMALFAEDQLRFLGHEVIIAHNGKEGLKQAQQEKPDLIVLDVMMPEMDGLEVCKRLKSDSATRDIPILMLTARGQKEDVAQGLDIGADDYLTKPYNKREFEARVNALLRRTRSKRSIEKQNSLVFVLMPFAEEHQAIYEEAVKKTVEESGLICKRVDDFFKPIPIMKDVKRGIHDAALIIADLSGKNPNVFYEVGMAHAQGKTPVLLTQDMDNVPPKLRDVRCIVYENGFDGAEKLKQVLTKTIRDLQQSHFVTKSIFSTKTYPMESNKCFALLPPTDSAHNTFRHIIHDVVTASGLVCESAQRVFSTGRVMDKIWVQINKARTIVADLSGQDPDVFYLTGISHGLNKPVILLARNQDEIPFDLKERSRMIYSTETLGAGLEAKKELTAVLQKVLAESGS